MQHRILLDYGSVRFPAWLKYYACGRPVNTAEMARTIGGWGASYTTVSRLEELEKAVSGSEPTVIVINGAISGAGKVSIGSSKSLVGAPGSCKSAANLDEQMSSLSIKSIALTGIELSLNGSMNVILRNLKISAAQGPAISVEKSRSVWIDHCDLSSTSNGTGELGNSLVSVTRGSDLLTVTATLFRNHPQALSVGHADSNGEEDRGKLRATLARNHFRDVGNAISYRFGVGHIFNSYFENAVDGVNTRMGADLLIESSVFEGSARAIVSENSTETGYATLRDVMLGGSTSTAPAGNATADDIPYPYDWYLWRTDSVKASVARQAGQTLEFLTWD